MARPGRHRQFLIAATLVMASVATTLVTALVIGGLGRTGQTANTTPSPAATRDGSPSTTPSPLSTPSSSPSFTVAPEVVLNPALISTQRHADVSLLIDGGGAAHIVTTLATPDGYDGSAGIVYLSNVSGTWVSERLTEPPEGFMHVDPVLARDTDSSLWVAYAEVTETGSRGVFVLTTRAGGWSEATLIADCNCSSPSLAIAQGVAHLALKESAPFEQSGIARTMHATNARGGWSVTEVAAGTAPMLALAPDGRPFILFSDNGNLLFAEWQGEAGGFAVSAGPGTSSAARYRPSLAFRPDGTLDAIWADGNTLWWAQGQSSQWSTPETLLTDLTDADPQGIAIGADGIMHGVAVGWQAGVWHVSGRAGTFDARQLAEGMPAGAALAVDQQGRAHIAYVIGRGYEPGHGVTAPELWYGVWPEAGIAD